MTLFISFFRLEKAKISVSKSYIRSANIVVCKINIHLDIRNGTYGSLAFISGVEHKNPSSGCDVTAKWKIWDFCGDPPGGFQWNFTEKSWFYVIFFVYEFHIVFKGILYDCPNYFCTSTSGLLGHYEAAQLSDQWTLHESHWPMESRPFAFPGSLSS